MVIGLLLALNAGLGTPARPASLRDVLEVADLSSIAISPDGRWVAYRVERSSVDRNERQLDWWLVPTQGEVEPRRLAAAGEGDWQDGTLLSEPPVWTSDSSAILYRKTADAQVQIWLTKVADGTTRPITHDAANVRSFILLPGDRITYETGATRDEEARAERAEYDGGVLIDHRVDPSRPLVGGSRIGGRWATDRIIGFWNRSAGILAGASPRFTTTDLKTLAATRTIKPPRAAGHEPIAPFARIEGLLVDAHATSGDGRGTAYSLTEGRGSRVMVERPDGSARICTEASCRQRVRDVIWDPGADAVIFTATGPAFDQTLFRWDVRSGEVRRLAGGHGTLNGGRDGTRPCEPSGRFLVCIAAAANDPPTLVRIDLDAGSTHLLAEPNAGLAAQLTSRFQTWTWRSAEGREFTGQLILPAAAGRHPLFVTYYLCDGFLRGGTGDAFPLRQLASAGIAAMCINRIATDTNHPDQVREYRLAQEAVGSAINSLASAGIVDCGKVGMGGVSFGGEATMWIGTHSSFLKAISIQNSLVTPTYYWFSAMPGRGIVDVVAKVWHVGDPDVDRRGWRATPAMMVERLRAPLLMQLPEREFRLNVEVAARLGREGRAAELWAFPDEAHIAFQPRHQLAINQRNLDWFRFWLQGEENTDPAAADQNLRWRRLRERSPSKASAVPRDQASTSASATR